MEILWNTHVYNRKVLLKSLKKEKFTNKKNVVRWLSADCASADGRRNLFYVQPKIRCRSHAAPQIRNLLEPDGNV